MPMSRTSTSGRRRIARSNASRPSYAVYTTWPLSRSSSAIESIESRLSSASSTVREPRGFVVTAARALDATAAAALRGSFTTKRLPRPSPSLAAVIVPPCSSTRPLASARPMPRPPAERSSADCSCANIVNTPTTPASVRGPGRSANRQRIGAGAASARSASSVLVITALRALRPGRERAKHRASPELGESVASFRASQAFPPPLRR